MDCNNSLCSLDILPSLSISTSFPSPLHFYFQTPLYLLISMPLLLLQLLFTMPTVSALVPPRSFFLFFYIFPQSYCFPFALLFMYCLTTVLFCCLPTLCLWHPPLPLRPSLFLPFRLSVLPFLLQVSVCQEMITEFRNAVSCKKSSRMRRRRPLSSSAALRHPTRIALGAPRPLRLVREMRLSNGKLYSGAGPLTGGAGGGAGGTAPPDLGPGPQRILDDPLGANTTPPPPAPTPVMLPARSCTHVRICQECRRIQSLRSSSSIGSTSTRIPPSSAPLPRLPPPPPPSSSNTDSEGGGGPSPRRLHHSPPPHTPRPIPPPQSSNKTDLLGDQE